MLRFGDFEALGPGFAGITGKSDGAYTYDALRSDLSPVRKAGVNPEGLIITRQIHGIDVLEVGRDCRGVLTREADALITNDPEAMLGTLVADCVPVYLFDPVHDALGLAHAGRRGVCAAIVQRVVQLMGLRYNTCPGDLHALIGPSAGRCCYQVSEAMVADFVAAGLPAYERYLDLWEANAMQLEAMGVARVNIIETNLCTICDERFHSYRREGTKARNLALLGLSAPSV